MEEAGWPSMDWCPICARLRLLMAHWTQKLPTLSNSYPRIKFTHSYFELFSSGPAPPFVPRRKDHAVKIINADADPFPSLHKTIMPKGPLLLPANQMMSQGITLNAPPMMMFSSQQR
jgi:hypothetical protein